MSHQTAGMADIWDCLANHTSDEPTANKIRQLCTKLGIDVPLGIQERVGNANAKMLEAIKLEEDPETTQILRHHAAILMCEASEELLTEVNNVSKLITERKEAMKTADDALAKGKTAEFLSKLFSMYEDAMKKREDLIKQKESALRKRNDQAENAIKLSQEITKKQEDRLKGIEDKLKKREDRLTEYEIWRNTAERLKLKEEQLMNWEEHLRKKREQLMKMKDIQTERENLQIKREASLRNQESMLNESQMRRPNIGRQFEKNGVVQAELEKNKGSRELPSVLEQILMVVDNAIGPEQDKQEEA